MGKSFKIVRKKTYCVHSAVFQLRTGGFLCCDCDVVFERLPLNCGYAPLIICPTVKLPAMKINTILRYHEPASRMTVFFRKGSLCSRWRSKFWMN